MSLKKDTKDDMKFHLLCHANKIFEMDCERKKKNLLYR